MPTLAEELHASQELSRQRREAVRGWCEGLHIEDWAYDGCGGDTFVINGKEYLVYTDAEVQAACEERIEEMLWSLLPSFLGRMTGHDPSIFKCFGSLYEIANGPIRSLITDTCGWAAFIEAVLVDTPRKNWIGPCDGVETQHTDENDRLWFLYRIF
jgi:hypothetical protein